MLVWGVLLATSAGLMVAACLGGPSAAVPRVGVGPAGRTDVAVTGLCWAAILVGGLSVGLGLVALARGQWTPPLWPVVLIVVVLLTLLPVAGSTDALDYAVYGRIAALGHDPWVWTPSRLIGLGDPIGRLAPATWRHTPAVYGPVAVGLFRLASMIGGTSMAATVLVFKALAGLAFLATSAALHHAAGPASRTRVHVLWSLNPLMWWAILVGAHIDGIAAALLATAVLTLRRPAHSAPAGVLVGLAVAVKAPYMLAGAGLMWLVRRSPAALLAGLGAAAVTVCGGYLLAGPTAIRALLARAGDTSGIDPWPVRFGSGLVPAAGALLLAVIVWWGLSRRIDSPLLPAFALALGWLATSPVQHPWYDAMLFPLLALLPRTPLDALLVARGVVASLAYVPGAAQHLTPDWLTTAVQDVYPSHIAARLLMVTVLLIALLALVRPAPTLELTDGDTPHHRSSVPQRK